MRGGQRLGDTPVMASVHDSPRYGVTKEDNSWAFLRYVINDGRWSDLSLSFI